MKTIKEKKDTLSEKIISEGYKENNIVNKKIIFAILLALLASIFGYLFWQKISNKSSGAGTKNLKSIVEKATGKKSETIVNEENNQILISSWEKMLERDSIESNSSLSIDFKDNNSKKDLASLNFSMNSQVDAKKNKFIKISNGVVNFNTSLVPFSGEFALDIVVYNNELFIKLNKIPSLLPVKDSFIGKWFLLDDLKNRGYNLNSEENSFKNIILFHKLNPLVSLKKTNSNNTYDMSFVTKNLEKLVAEKIKLASERSKENTSSQELNKQLIEAETFIKLLSDSVEENKSSVIFKDGYMNNIIWDVTGVIDLTEINNTNPSNIDSIGNLEKFDYRLKMNENLYYDKNFTIEKPKIFENLTKFLLKENPNMLIP